MHSLPGDGSLEIGIHLWDLQAEMRLESIIAQRGTYMLRDSITAHQPDYHALNLELVSWNEEGLHLGIGRLQPYLLAFGVKALEGGFVLHKSHHHISAIGNGLALYDHQITFMNALTNHRATYHSKHIVLGSEASQEMLRHRQSVPTW